MLHDILTPEVELFVLMGSLLILSKVLVSLATRIGLAPVFVLVSTGIILGPGLLHVIPWGDEVLESGNGERLVVEILEYIGKIGVLIILFLAGLETDLPGMRRAGAVGAAAALGGATLPFAGGLVLCRAFGMEWLQAAFVGTILTATSISVTVMTLHDIGKLRTPVGQGILSAAVIDDLLGIFLLTVVLSFAREGTSLSVVAIKTFGFLVGGFLFGWFMFPPILARVRRMKAPHPTLAISLGLLFLYAGAAEFFGVEPIIGAYLAGFCLSQTAFSRQISESVETVGQGLFIPLFFITVGLQATFGGLGGHASFIALFLGTALLGKIVGSGVAARVMGMKARDSLRLGLGMMPRGEVALVVAAAGAQIIVPGTDTPLLEPEVFSATILLVIVTALVTPQGLRSLYREREPAADPAEV